MWNYIELTPYLTVGSVDVCQKSQLLRFRYGGKTVNMFRHCAANTKCAVYIKDSLSSGLTEELL